MRRLGLLSACFSVGESKGEPKGFVDSPPAEALSGGEPGPARAFARNGEEKAAAQAPPSRCLRPKHFRILGVEVFRQATPGVVAVARGYRQGERRRSGGAEDGLPPSLGSGFVPCLRLFRSCCI